MKTLTAPFPLALVALALGCAPARTSPATQPSSPAAFDAARSDPKAVALADRVFAAAGGAAWDKAKEIRWQLDVVVDDKTTFEGRHAWDRWNGRHQETLVSPAQTTIAMHELYSDVGSAYYLDGNGRKHTLSRAEQTKAIERARQHFAEHHYWLAIPYKLKDPGVILQHGGERLLEDGRKVEELKVTFDPAVGTGTYYVIVNPETAVIESVEIEKAEGRLGYGLADWVEVAGLKFAGTWQNLGYKGEVIRFRDIQVSDLPNDDLYVPSIDQAVVED